MLKFISWFFKSKEKVHYESICDTIEKLEDRIRVLEESNIEQTNSLYECWNSLDARIDILGEKAFMEMNNEHS